MEQIQRDLNHSQSDMSYQSLSDEIQVLKCPGSCVETIENPKTISAKEESTLMLHPSLDSPTLRDDLTSTAANTINLILSMNLALGNSEHLGKEMTNSCSTRKMSSNEKKEVLPAREMNSGRNMCSKVTTASGDTTIIMQLLLKVESVICKKLHSVGKNLIGIERT